MDAFLFDLSGGRHKCSSCSCCPAAGDTTQSPHPCWFAFENRDEIETVDNGMGYWVVRCRMYKPELYDYNAYCGTWHWQETRRKTLERAGYRCEICGTGKNLNVHHITYEHVWDERPEDLLVCCRSCHAKIHWRDRERLRRALPMFNRMEANP